MLVGYVEAKSGVTLNRLALRKGLQATLPHYMVPARLILLDALPKTGSGKLDRKRCHYRGDKGLAGSMPRVLARIPCWMAQDRQWMDRKALPHKLSCRMVRAMDKEARIMRASCWL